MIGYGNSLGVYILNPYIYGTGTSYLLDTYSAAAAYSLRQLKTGVTNVVRVRRSSDNAESDFTASDINDGTLLSWVGAGNNASVVVWYDQSGNGRNMTQASATDQPRLIVSGAFETNSAGNKSLSSNVVGTAQMTISSDLIKNSSYVYKWFVVEQASASGDYGEFISTASSATAARFASYSGFTTNERDEIRARSLDADSIDVLVSGTNRPNGSAYIRCDIVEYTNRNGYIYNNNSLVASETGTFTSGNSISNTNSVRQDIGLSQPFPDYLTEVIYFTTDESANRTAIESDINTHYSIY